MRKVYISFRVSLHLLPAVYFYLLNMNGPIHENLVSKYWSESSSTLILCVREGKCSDESAQLCMEEPPWCSE